MSSLIRILFPFFVFSVPSEAWRCGRGAIYSEAERMCYQVFKVALRFADAESICEHLGGHLASITDAAHDARIQDIAHRRLHNEPVPFWIGAKRTNRTWSWTDGQHFNYTAWDEALTPADDYRACLARGWGSQSWFAAGCDWEQPFICASPALKSATTRHTRYNRGECDEGWSYYDETDKCYKVIERATWFSAETACMEEGAHLVSIHSREENRFVYHLAGMEGWATDAADWPEQTFIGLRRSEDGTFTWSDGTVLDFINWAPSEPDNGFKEDCVQMFSDDKGGSNPRDGRWNNIRCKLVMRNAVCKKHSKFYFR